MEKLVKLTLVILFISSFGITANSQEDNSNGSTESKLKLNLSTDIVSSYVWRGTEFGKSPAVQPTLSISKGNFELGFWGSVATNNSFKEIDLYAKYSIKGFTLALTDYYVPTINGVSSSPDSRYFVYADQQTAHTMEASLQYKGNENFPVWVIGGVFLYGNDKRWGYDAAKDSLQKSYYSSYVEAGYTFNIQKCSADLFVGVTPSAGAYARSAGVVNIGVTGSRKIKISNDFELPIKGSVIFNPQTSDVFFVFGLTI